MEKIELRSKLFNYGNTPFDYYARAELEVFTDDKKHQFFGIESRDGQYRPYVSKESGVELICMPFHGKYFKTIENVKKEYPFIDFKPIEKELRELEKGYFTQLDNTAFHKGMRSGGYFSGGHLVKFIEFVVYIKAEKEYLYCQIIEDSGKFEYSVTNISIYLRLQYSELYDFYYPEKKEPVYFFKSDSLDDFDNYEYPFLKGDFEEEKKNWDK